MMDRQQARVIAGAEQQQREAKEWFNHSLAYGPKDFVKFQNAIAESDPKKLREMPDHDLKIVGLLAHTMVLELMRMMEEEVSAS